MKNRKSSNWWCLRHYIGWLRGVRIRQEPRIQVEEVIVKARRPSEDGVVLRKLIHPGRILHWRWSALAEREEKHEAKDTNLHHRTALRSAQRAF